MKAVIIYYSLSGNTKKIAEKIRESIGADIAEIKTVLPYEGSYNEIVEKGHKEVNSGFSPAIRPLDAELEKYDTVILGTPVWWYTFAPAVKTFFEKNNLSGKTIYPFATNGGWIGHTFEDIKKICPASNVKSGLDVYFSSSNLKTKESQIKSWISNIEC